MGIVLKSKQSHNSAKYVRSQFLTICATMLGNQYSFKVSLIQKNKCEHILRRTMDELLVTAMEQIQNEA